MQESQKFATLGLRQELVENLKTLEYTSMTPIQAKALPHIIQGKDVIGQGKTGSGKTAAFGLGLLEKLNVKQFRVQSLVLCPTRELADQVAKEIRRLARGIHNIKVLTLCGGMPFGPQVGSLEHGAHIIVGTPGRVEDHIRKRHLDLSNLNMLVLDEADRMLEMGFSEALDAIVGAAPKDRQTLLFSATFPDQISDMSASIMRNPVKVEVESTHETSTIEQLFYQVEGDDARMEAVELLLLKHAPESAVIFCSTKIDTVDLADFLHNQGFSALALNGDLEQKDRDKTLVRFANKSTQVLVATDVAARGLDVESLDMVINFHLSRDPEVHVHRIGRTGRAGAKGKAFSFYSASEKYKLSEISRQLGQKLSFGDLPSEDEIMPRPLVPVMVTLQISGGKRQKVRAGDILGCLTADKNITGNQIGKISLFHNTSFVAVKREIANAALKKIETGQLKGRNFRVRKI